MVSLEEVLEEAQKNDRVCPLPLKWLDLYRLLPNKKGKGTDREPASPLVLGGWSSPVKYKRLRLREHIEWASEHNCLDTIYEFMKNLKEEEWCHE